MAKLKAAERLLRDFSERRPLRGGSLIVTIFGDSISQHGNAVWLGSLIKALEPFGLNQRLVRTAVYRLTQDDWLVALPSGRRSYYSFTDFGLRHYEKAARRIYAAQHAGWDGQWTLVIPGLVSDQQRDALRKELSWLGYGALSPGLMAYPGADRQSLDETLQELGVADKVAVLNAHTEELASRFVLQTMANDCWRLQELSGRYDAFLQRFRPVLKAVDDAKKLAPEDAFQIRTLLIHEYRRILLKDTDLPDEVLPANWVGRAACNLTANLYRVTHQQAEVYLREVMETADGRLPKAARSYYQRFGGL